MRTHACCAHAASSLTRRRLLSGGRDEDGAKKNRYSSCDGSACTRMQAIAGVLAALGYSPLLLVVVAAKHVRGGGRMEKPRNRIPLCISFLRISVVASYGADCYEACL